MADNYLYSTLTSDNLYTGWRKVEGNDSQIEKQVLVKGGANLAPKRIGDDTPAGVVTEVSHEDLDFLQANPVFKQHVTNGFVIISQAKTDPEVAAVDMNRKDKSAPVVPEDYVDTDPAKPIDGNIDPVDLKNGKRK